MTSRSRYRLLLAVSCVLSTYSFLNHHKFPLNFNAFWPDQRQSSSRRPPPPSPVEERQQVPLASLESSFFTWSDPDAPPLPKPPYKPEAELSLPIPDPFPLLSEYPAPSRKFLLQHVPKPPKSHSKEEAPLLIGFTRNWPLLLQCLTSYIAAGWPPSSIYVVENTGTMFSNKQGQLTLQNPFYLNHTQLGMLGVNVIITPTLLTFAQLQNFYLWFVSPFAPLLLPRRLTAVKKRTALNRNWDYFFWSHQDLLVFSPPHDPSSTLYSNVLSVMQYLKSPAAPKWAHHFFAYDHLTLVNLPSVLSIGGWDTHIPFYSTDCDMYTRLMWAGFWQGESPEVGLIFDVKTPVDDVAALLSLPGHEAGFNGTVYEDVVELGEAMQEVKYNHSNDNSGRNTWQLRQRGGQEEPFYRDAAGFEVGTKMMIDLGRAVFAEKWGHRGCDIALMEGIESRDAWRLERDWEEGENGGEDGW
ncbi:hypothetical protein QBC36DRAFT_355045 [Triangularia setosa]|uniref:Uncharacterized protein n=1 Tax=Triangularia setosa TaxID=2587417 RepID=A0AAN6W5A4_9PEZI|nr:hypothetical protein QBC36DRAFT_355045 [Podospora setosa]